MRRISFICLSAMALIAAAARSQYIGAGSTVAGDYLRAVGIAAAGMGSFNRDTAIAESIHADTAIRVDSYEREILRQDRVRWAKMKHDLREKQKAYAEATRKRLREHPEGYDVLKGDALNAMLDQLNDPAIHESAFRSIPVPLSVAAVRRIPFRLDRKNAIFSMQRLTPGGKGKWPIAFQNDNYSPERRAFERALHNALDQMIDGKIPRETIDRYEEAVRDLSAKLEREFVGRVIDRRYTEAKTRIHEMKRIAELLRTTEVQAVVADLDRYSGTTVDDLRQFMRAHNLRFAVAETPEEKKLYPELYESLAQVRDIVTDQGEGRGK